MYFWGYFRGVRSAKALTRENNSPITKTVANI
ncbi:MAG: hypothetical protein ACI8UG_002634, partial [Gammaproteobacteria bacterium]